MKKLIFPCVCAIGGVLTATYAQPYIHENSDATLIIVTVFAVFAGFLVAIITVIGDPGLVPNGSWRAVELRRDQIQHRIVLHSLLFTCYLLAIAGLFIAVVVNKIPELEASLSLKLWVDRIYIFISVSSFLLSFGLPFSLMSIQMARLDQESQRRLTYGPSTKDDHTT